MSGWGYNDQRILDYAGNTEKERKIDGRLEWGMIGIENNQDHEKTV